MKKIITLFKILLFIYLGYLVVAIGLGFFGVINYIPLAPAWGIKTPNYVEPTKIEIIDFEQPIVYFQNDSIKVLSIKKENNNFRKEHILYKKEDFISININYRNTNFNVPITKNYSIERDTYDLPKKTICLSDIEGNFDGFSRFLKGNKIINEKFEWTFGNGHLVLLGDYFDRGKYVNECLWLIYKLEQEAKKVGGRVHFILGNHETMNIIGAYDDKTFKYVNGKFFANADFLDYEYKNWYSKQTELGRWLRTKNSIEQIGNYLFVHGGISPKLANSKLTLNQINLNIRNGLDKSPETHTETEILLLRNNGPLWYRGLAKEEISNEELDKILSQFQSDKIIIGHSVVDEVKTFYENKVIDIDLKHSENKNIFGLLINEDGFYEIDDKSRTRKITTHNTVYN